jgi:hypothetical protein
MSQNAESSKGERGNQLEAVWMQERFLGVNPSKLLLAKVGHSQARIRQLTS